MDLFACSVPSESCQKFHFHDFMVAAQDTIQLARLDGAKDPIDKAADRLIAPGHIICFDEMEVRDIADAMIIKRLFDGLWACLLYTSPSPRDLSTSRMPSSA